MTISHSGLLFWATLYMSSVKLYCLRPVRIQKAEIRKTHGIVKCPEFNCNTRTVFRRGLDDCVFACRWWSFCCEFANRALYIVWHVRALSIDSCRMAWWPTWRSWWRAGKCSTACSRQTTPSSWKRNPVFFQDTELHCRCVTSSRRRLPADQTTGAIPEPTRCCLHASNANKI